MRKAGITRFRFHDLRYTFDTRLFHAGVDVYTVQKLGRWKTIAMVLRYAHHEPESLRGGAKVLDQLRRESSTTLAHWGGASSGGMAEAIDLLVRPVGIEPTTLSLQEPPKESATDNDRV
jgi:hypothetical protein